jgi:hypothetical protein
MKKKTIPAAVKEEVRQTIERFNNVELTGADCRYIARFHGKYLYLDRDDFGTVGPICRLEYKGGKVPWEMAIYKYSSERYDPEEFWFPGSELVDGTVQGALKAGMEAYP